MRPWLEEVLREGPQPLLYLYKNPLRFIKSHPVLTVFKNMPYLFLTAASGAPYCLALVLRDKRIAGIEGINVRTGVARPARTVNLNQIQWSMGVSFTFGHMAEVLESLGVNLDNVAEVKATLLLLKPAFFGEMWHMRGLMRAEWTQYPEILSALSTEFMQMYERNDSDVVWDLLAQFMIAYIRTEG